MWRNFLILIFVLLFSSCSGILWQKTARVRKVPALTHPRLLEGELRLAIKNIHLLSGDSLKAFNKRNGIPENQLPTLRVWSALIRPFQNQKNVRCLLVQPKPTSIFKEPENGITIFYWDLGSALKEKDSIIVLRKFRYVCFDYKPDPGMDSIRYDRNKIPKYIRTFYTKSEPFLHLTEKIKQTAHQIAGREHNPFKQARLLHHWVHKNMTYIYPPKKRGATAALESMSGDCGQYADLFIALARSLNIPARLQAGFVFSAQRVSYHVWAQIYLPHTGWFPVDPTRKDGFGFLDNKRLIASVGMNIPLKFVPVWATYRNSEAEHGRTDFMQLATIVKSGFKASIITNITVIKDSLLTLPTH